MIKYKVLDEKRYSVGLDKSNKYCLHYKKGKIVKALEGTFGVFCFKTRNDAERYASRFDIIVRVDTLDQEGYVPKGISPAVFESTLDNFYDDKDFCLTKPVMLPIIGTICYPKVKVLD